ncbi:hypothetical protein IAQ61_000695 [Plenodomus lingam]|uniref:uncharacterized protein n=1 Tax=Leptosphaeria maculans TaxID=5022 RepID=UPI003331D392|nr:hypothetical protein IAQ61_000695 [Plenodomus lingam]
MSWRTGSGDHTTAETGEQEGAPSPPSILPAMVLLTKMENNNSIDITESGLKSSKYFLETSTTQQALSEKTQSSPLQPTPTKSPQNHNSHPNQPNPTSLPMSQVNTTTWRTTADHSSDSDEDYFELNPTQAISGRNIDPMKLKVLLRTKFGAGAYDMHVRTIPLIFTLP